MIRNNFSEDASQKAQGTVSPFHDNVDEIKQVLQHLTELDTETSNPTLIDQAKSVERTC